MPISLQRDWERIPPLRKEIPMDNTKMRTRVRRRGGYSIAEVMIVGAIVAVLMSMAVPGTQQFLTDQTATDMTRAVSSAFNIARVEALRTGSNQVVFFGVGGAGDTAGNALVDTNGQSAAVLILDDGPTGAATQNCRIDAGERVRTITADASLSWGYTHAGTTKAPGDGTTRASASGSSFATPAGAGATWVLFRPDGAPVAVDSGCNRGTLGTGNGAIYFTNGSRDQAVVLNALGGTTVHTWNKATNAWTN
jgi:Tfp pilus assembly protein FimT